MSIRAVAALLLIAASAAAQFDPALPGYDFEFPRDHGSHDNYRTEWWYYTGHLESDSGRRYGFEVTFFRVGVVPPSAQERTSWGLHNLSLAHFAVTDINGKAFRYYEKLNRSSPFTASQATGHLDVFNEGWSAKTAPDGAWHLVASGGVDAIDLTLRTRKPPAVHGENGISVKAEGPGFASHYYSMTRLEASGSINGQSCRGIAWMDHEFGSSQLRESQQGWDWFSIQLDNDTELMLYQIRRKDGTADVTSSGTLVTSDGTVIHLAHDQIRVRQTGRWKSPASGAIYPMGWNVSVPSLQIAVSLQPLLRQQELDTRLSTRITYWEGAVLVSGSFENVGVTGEGYVEMTGYAGTFRPP